MVLGRDRVRGRESPDPVKPPGFTIALGSYPGDIPENLRKSGTTKPAARTQPAATTPAREAPGRPCGRARLKRPWVFTGFFARWPEVQVPRGLRVQLASGGP